jgi:paired amphipathic helix protein Sin3a
MFPVAEFDAACGPSDGLHDEVLDHEVLNGPRSGSRSAGGGQGLPIPAGDLRRQLLKTAQEKSLGIEGGGGPVITQSTSTSPHDAADNRRGCSWEAQTEDNGMWIRTNQTSTSSGVDLSRRKPFFANTTVYTLLSLLQVTCLIIIFSSF